MPGIGGVPRGHSKNLAIDRLTRRLASGQIVVASDAIYINASGQIDLQLDASVTGILTNTSTGLGLHTQLANKVLAGPTSGGAASPTFRLLVAADVPALAYVTSVGLSLPAIFTVSGSPVTSSGTLTAVLATQLANLVWSGPGSGGAAAPTFRALVKADLPAVTVYTDVTAVFSVDVKLGTAGNKLFIKEGSNASMGVATLSGGTVTVSTNKVTANSRIFLTNQDGVGPVGSLYVSARTAGTSFVISSTNAGDASAIGWVLLEPA